MHCQRWLRQHVHVLSNICPHLFIEQAQQIGCAEPDTLVRP